MSRHHDPPRGHWARARPSRLPPDLVAHRGGVRHRPLPRLAVAVGGRPP